MPRTYKILLTWLAQNDLAEIYDYISADSPENALLGTGYRHLVQGNYRIIFRIQGDSGLIMRVIHGARLLQL